MPNGSVSLVGAGPGDPELLTMKAYKVLQSADVIFYDSLLANNFQKIFPQGVPHFHVGKRCDNHILPQRQIEKQLIKWALAGHHVVRLKGGDPFIFGRGGEEVQAIMEKGISINIVPGLSSLNGIASNIGLPLTHRGIVRKLMIVEGHTLGNEPSDYHDLACFNGTLAIFMASKKVAEIAHRLIEAGANPNKKLILVESDAAMNQHWQIHDLNAAVNHKCLKTTKGPGIIYVGATVEIFESWHEQISHLHERIQSEQVATPIF